MPSWLLVLGLAACDGGEPQPAPATPIAVPTAPAPVRPVEPAPLHPSTTTARIAASHVLIEYAGAMSTSPSVTRTREEARVLAESVRVRAAAGDDFAGLARQFSDDSSKSRGGSLGHFDKGTMVAAFELAVVAMPVGAISPVVESAFGFHVIKREAMNQIHCAQIIVSFAGSARPIEGVARSRDDASARATAAKSELEAGTAWPTVVRKYSDGPAQEDMGDLGWFSRRQLMPVLDEAAFVLDVGQTSGVVESPVGFHLVHRLE